MEGEATVKVFRTKTSTHKDKEDKESDVSELNESTGAENNKDSVEEPKDMSYNSREKQKLSCPQCDYVCEKRYTFNKHINTKHQCIKTEIIDCTSKCSLCTDTFKTKNEFEMHIKEHIDEIEELDISTLTNGHEVFECNLCSFESGLGDSIREHLIDHVNHSRNDEKENKEQTLQSDKKSLLDEYDEDGNYIGDDPALMDSESETETDGDD